MQYDFADILVTVQWDDQWRYGTIDSAPDPFFGMIKHQSNFNPMLVAKNA